MFCNGTWDDILSSLLKHTRGYHQKKTRGSVKAGKGSSHIEEGVRIDHPWLRVDSVHPGHDDGTRELEPITQPTATGGGSRRGDIDLH